MTNLSDTRSTPRDPSRTPSPQGVEGQRGPILPPHFGVFGPLGTGPGSRNRGGERECEEWSGVDREVLSTSPYPTLGSVHSRHPRGGREGGSGVCLLRPNLSNNPPPRLSESPNDHRPNQVPPQVPRTWGWSRPWGLEESSGEREGAREGDSYRYLVHLYPHPLDLRS